MVKTKNFSKSSLKFKLAEETLKHRNQEMPCPQPAPIASIIMMQRENVYSIP